MMDYYQTSCGIITRDPGEFDYFILAGLDFLPFNFDRIFRPLIKPNIY